MKKIIMGLISVIAVIGFTGCGASKVQKLSTGEAKKILVIGKTTQADVKKEFGKPNSVTRMEESIAKEAMKRDVSLASTGVAGSIRSNISMGRTIANAVINKKDKTVSYWKYTHYKEKRPTGFAALRGGQNTRKGAILILLFDNKNILVDYKHKNYNK